MEPRALTARLHDGAANVLVRRSEPSLREGPAAGQSGDVGRLRVVLAEDSLLVREGLRALLADDAGHDVVALCGDLDELLAAVDRHRPDILVTDIRMPPTRTDEGIRAAQTLRRAHPDIAVLVLSQFVEASYAVALLEGGSRSRGYILKDRVTDPEQLWTAVRTVASGGSYIDDAVVDALVAGRRKEGAPLLDRLSYREAEILAIVARGWSNPAIAAHLGISTRAVEKHVSSIFTKLDVPEDAGTHRRVKAALLALQHQAS
jgi:DNA-binding NarL/FixJ family response regulator